MPARPGLTLRRVWPESRHEDIPELIDCSVGDCIGRTRANSVGCAEGAIRLHAGGHHDDGFQSGHDYHHHGFKSGDHHYNHFHLEALPWAERADQDGGAPLTAGWAAVEPARAR